MYWCCTISPVTVDKQAAEVVQQHEYLGTVTDVTICASGSRLMLGDAREAHQHMGFFLHSCNVTSDLWRSDEERSDQSWLMETTAVGWSQAATMQS